MTEARSGVGYLKEDVGTRGFRAEFNLDLTDRHGLAIEGFVP